MTKSYYFSHVVNYMNVALFKTVWKCSEPNMNIFGVPEENTVRPLLGQPTSVMCDQFLFFFK